MDESRDVKPRPSVLRRFLWLLVRQPLWAVLFGLFFGTLYGGTWPDYLLAFRASLMFSLCIGVALWAVEAFVEPRLRDVARDRVGPHWRTGAVYVLAAVLGSYAGAALVHLFVLPGFLSHPRSFIVAGLFTLLFVTLFTGINYAIVFYHQALDRARAVEQARAELAQAELRALRAQIHPHFLFNTLNTIASLIASDPAAAEDTLTRLADLFRYTLRASEREHSPFGDELAFLRDVLAIERLRFGDRLIVREAIEPGLDAVPVPSLLLQPVVENAVRHGAGARTTGGTVTLAARRAGDTLVVEVADDGPGLDDAAGPRGEGFGLHSVRERLRVAGPPHALDIDTAPGRGTRVRITLPLLASGRIGDPS